MRSKKAEAGSLSQSYTRLFGMFAVHTDICIRQCIRCNLAITTLQKSTTSLAVVLSNKYEESHGSDVANKPNDDGANAATWVVMANSSSRCIWTREIYSS